MTDSKIRACSARRSWGRLDRRRWFVMDMEGMCDRADEALTQRAEGLPGDQQSDEPQQ
jgi:hypothetical protein